MQQPPRHSQHVKLRPCNLDQTAVPPMRRRGQPFGVRTRSNAPQWASMDARHSFQATIVRWRHTFFSAATDALMASASTVPATCAFVN